MGKALLEVPHPWVAAAVNESSNRVSRVFHWRRREGRTQQQSIQAKAALPRRRAYGPTGVSLAVVLAVVAIVIVVVTAPVPEIAGGLVAAQVGDPAIFDGETEQARATWPVKPPVGVMVTVAAP